MTFIGFSNPNDDTEEQNKTTINLEGKRTRATLL